MATTAVARTSSLSDLDGPEVPRRRIQRVPHGLRALCILIILYMMAFVSALLGLSELILHLLDDDASEQGAFMAGLTALVSLVGFFSNPMWGFVSDSFGRRPMLMLGQAAFVANLVSVALAQSLTVIVVANVLGALLSAMTAVTSSVVVDISETDQELARSFGVFGGCFSLGLILGAAFGASVASATDSLAVPLFASAALGGLALLYTSLFMPETVQSDAFIRLQSGETLRKRDILARSWNPFRTLSVLHSTPRLFQLAFANFFYIAGAAVVAVFFAFVEERFNWGSESAGAWILVFSLCAASAQGLLLPHLSKSQSHEHILVRCIPVLAFSLVLFGLSWEPWHVYVVLLVMFYGLLTPAVLSAEMSREVPPDLQGKLHGAISAVTLMASVFGSLSAGGLFYVATQDNAVVYLPGAPFFLGALLCLVCLYFYRRAIRFPPASGTRSDEPTVLLDEDASPAR